MHNAEKKIFLILDGHPVHRSTKVKKFVESTKGQLRIYYLPPYSPELNPDEQVWNNQDEQGRESSQPELNPDEQVWNNVKGKIGRSTIKGPNDLDSKIRGHLIALQRNPGKIRMFFQYPCVRYAA